LGKAYSSMWSANEAMPVGAAAARRSNIAD
jgi:hypothetical protein